MTRGNTYAELNAVLEQASRTSVAATPVTDEQLLGLQYRWATALSARLDSTIELAGTEPLTDSVAAAWRRLAAERTTLRAVLDAHEPRSAALAEAMRGEFLMLAMAAGLVGPDDQSEESIRIGRALHGLVRSGRVQLVDEPAGV